MHALILANGEHPPIDFIDAVRREASLFIATDGAANSLLHHNLIPHFVLGDLDSLEPHVEKALPVEAVVALADQECSDLDKALQFAQDHGATHVTVLGAGGGRPDHAFTAASLLLKYANCLNVVLRSPNGTMRLAQGEVTIVGKPGDTVSLVVFTQADGVCLTGVEWPLRDETLFPGSRAVSNRMSSSEATLSIRDGWAFVCHLYSDDHDR